MIRIRIVSEDRCFPDVDDIRPNWINQQIAGRNRAGQPVWVTVEIEEPGVHVTLLTATAPSRGGRPLSTFNEKEQEIIRLWQDRVLAPGLNGGGPLVAFFAQLRKLL